MGGEVQTPTVDEVAEKLQDFADEKKEDASQDAEDELVAEEAIEMKELDNSLKGLA